MKNHNNRYFGKWSAFCAVAALVAASGQACPPEAPLPPGPTASLTGVWTGPISGEGTFSRRFKFPNSANPNDDTNDTTLQTAGTVQIVVDDVVRLVSLPLPAEVSALSFGFAEQAVTVFNVGETQTIANTTTRVIPTGTADTITLELNNTTTFTVMESTLTADHFRAVYETTRSVMNSEVPSNPMSMTMSFTQLSTGTLTLDATLVNGQVMFSADFNINGSSERKTGATTTETGNGFVVGSLTGTLSAN